MRGRGHRHQPAEALAGPAGGLHVRDERPDLRPRPDWRRPRWGSSSPTSRRVRRPPPPGSRRATLILRVADQPDPGPPDLRRGRRRAGRARGPRDRHRPGHRRHAGFSPAQTDCSVAVRPLTRARPVCTPDLAVPVSFHPPRDDLLARPRSRDRRRRRQSKPHENRRASRSVPRFLRLQGVRPPPQRRAGARTTRPCCSRRPA